MDLRELQAMSGGSGGGGGGCGGGRSRFGGGGGGGTTSQKLTTNDALLYLKEVKDMFQDQRERYELFLEVMKDFKAQRLPLSLRTIRIFLMSSLDSYQKPDTSAAPLLQNAPHGRTSVQRYNELNSTAPTLQQMRLDKQHWRDRITSHAEHDLSVDRPKLDDDKAMLKVHKEQRQHAEKDNRDRRNRDLDDREPEHESYRDFSSQRFNDKRKSSWKFEGFGVNSNISSYEDKDNLKRMYNQKFIFCEKVKERLGSSDDYQAFLKCLNIYCNGITKKNDLQNLAMMDMHPDL